MCLIQTTGDTASSGKLVTARMEDGEGGREGGRGREGEALGMPTLASPRRGVDPHNPQVASCEPGLLATYPITVAVKPAGRDRTPPGPRQDPTRTPPGPRQDPASTPLAPRPCMSFGTHLPPTPTSSPDHVLRGRPPEEQGVM